MVPAITPSPQKLNGYLIVLISLYLLLTPWNDYLKLALTSVFSEAFFKGW